MQEPNDNILKEEKAHLTKVISIVENAKQTLEQKLREIGADNLDKLSDLRADPETGTDFEMFLAQLHEKNLTFDLKGKYQRVEEFAYSIKNPYFARIDLKTSDPEIPSELYIGKFGYNDEGPVITDWRSSIASIYYRYRFPQKNITYKTSEGEQTADLNLKRTFDIHEGKLVKYYNNDIQLDENEIVIGKIEKRTGGVLEDIVETIQKDQMDIIEADPRQVCIVQGCVGSGKSTVAIHKLAHIFFHFSNFIHQDKSILIVKNQILIGYLATLFPKLGIFDINFKTLRDLMVNTIFREQLPIQVDLDKGQDTSSYTFEKVTNLNLMIDSVHKLYEEKIRSIFIDPDLESYAGFRYSREYTPYENLTEIINDLNEEAENIKDALKENPNNLRALVYKSNVRKVRSIIRKISDLRLAIKKDSLSQVLTELNIETSGTLDYLSTLIYLYVYRKLIGFNKTQIYEYCVIDEGQDFGLLEYALLGNYVLRGRFGIFGDLNQMILSDGITNWDQVSKVIPEAKNANVYTLETNYRSTKQIIDLANKLMANTSHEFLPKSVNRMGPDPIIVKNNTKEEMLNEFQQKLSDEVKNLTKTVGIICFDESLQPEVTKRIKDLNIKNIPVIEVESSKRITYLPKGIYIMALSDCKGLEFSKVYVLGLNIDKVNKGQHTREAFVAVTRAMNELVILGLND